MAAMHGVLTTAAVSARPADTANTIATGIQLISAALASGTDAALRQPPTRQPQVNAARLPEISSETKQAITTVIQSLLAAASAQNINGILESYAPTVDYMDRGRVNGAGVATDFTEYFARWPATNWALASQIVFRPVTTNKVQATFKMNFDVANVAENRRSTGTAAETLLFEFDPIARRFLIVSHHEKILGRYLSSSGSTANRPYSRTAAIETQAVASSPTPVDLPTATPESTLTPTPTPVPTATPAVHQENVIIFNQPKPSPTPTPIVMDCPTGADESVKSDTLHFKGFYLGMPLGCAAKLINEKYNAVFKEIEFKTLPPKVLLASRIVSSWLWQNWLAPARQNNK
jgi:hypothetical protein